MPNYDEQAVKAGWEKVGAKWAHKDHPGKIVYNARELWGLLPENLKRPYSVTPRVVEVAVPEPTKPEEPVKKVGRPKKIA